LLLNDLQEHQRNPFEPVTNRASLQVSNAARVGGLAYHQ
jgi:hypothetical protein